MASRPVQVLLPRHLGDAVLALPALRLLAARLAAPVRVLAQGAAADAVRGQGSFTVAPPSTLGHGPAIVLAPSFRAAWAARAAGAAPRIGAAGDLRGPLLTHVVPGPRVPLPHRVGARRLPKLLVGEHQADAFLRVVSAALAVLGAPAGASAASPAPAAQEEEQPPYVIDAATARQARVAWEAVARPRFVLHPAAAGAATKRWPEARWIALARALAPAVVLTGGPVDGAELARIAEAAQVPALAGPAALPIPVWASLAVLAGSVVAPDTGVVHVARAAGARTVVLFGSSDPARHAPRGAGALTLLHGGATLACSPCYAESCRAPTPGACMASVEVDDVVAAVRWPA